MKRNQSGFTLVEIAIVLVIIGLLLGGILKGQELVQNARVRNLADQQNAVQAAYFAFQDRYRALPGDYAAATANIPNVVAAPACGAAACVPGNSQITGEERVFAWHHLTNAGFIACPTCAANPAATAAVPGTNNSLPNAYNGFMLLEYANNYAVVAPAVAANVNHLKSGLQVPSNIMSEVDRKLDDGIPGTGHFRNSNTSPATCTTAGAPVVWNSLTPDPSCEAVNLF